MRLHLVRGFLRDRRFCAALVLAVAGCALPHRVEAQEPLRVGRPLTEALTDADPSLTGVGPFRAFRLRTEPGKMYAISVRSEEFDPVVKITRTVAGVTDVLTENDDSGGTLDSRALFRPPQPGTYLVLVHPSVDPDGRGAFEIEVEEVAGSPAAQPIGVGDAVVGELREEDELWGGAQYTLQLEVGEPVTILASSEDFDTMLEVGRWAGDEFEVLDSNDDGGDGTDSRLVVDPQESGEHVVRVSAFGSGVGAFTLRVLEGGDSAMGTAGEIAPETLAPPRPLQVGGRVASELDDSDPVLELGQPFEAWSFSAGAGERIIVIMRAAPMSTGDLEEEIDTYLALGRIVDGSWEELAVDDDGGGGRNSRLVHEIADAGEYVIRATTYGGGRGPYELELHSAPTPRPAPRASRIAAGESVTGVLESGDGVLQDGSFYDEWIYRSSRAGERITVTLESAAFDAFLAFGRGRGDDFEELSSNDDGEEGTDARLVFITSGPGEYVIRANTFGPFEGGPYTLRVQTGG